MNASVKIPNLDSSSSATPNGFSGNVLTTIKRDRIAAVNANIAQIAADAVGLPIALAGNVGPFGYNLLQSNAGIALDVSQSLQFMPTAKGKLLFSAAIDPIINNIVQGPTKEIDFNYGDSVSFLPGKLSSVSFTPVTDLVGTLHNTTDLVVDGNINVKALGLDIAGLSIGPLIDEGLPSVDLGHINLLDNKFVDHIDQVSGQPITLNFDCGTINGRGTEFAYGDICASSKFVDLGSAVDYGGGVYSDRIGVENCDGFNFSSREPFRPQTCTRTFDHYSDLYVNTPKGRLSVSSPDPLFFNPNNPTASTSDAGELALLSSLGYSAGEPSFDIPKGAPLNSFAVPEPESISGFGLAAAMLLVSAWQRRVGQRKGESA